ncbi:hypothetical protein JCM19237_6208 [Photobacterium aphoticum]|uniref:Uncharacterized protein n=1 Tax=Photobacterium aphoticum TaxID=754436 RepID=A0A090QJI8_9GAMM|nr:hypothetical protein JCM19237_6208 [Photobacterium aphoticum]
MNSKSMSAFFAENLSAPLTNVQWSWGSENEKGVYLRIWAEEVKDKRGMVYACDPADTRLGQKERLRHIKQIESGKPGYVVVITEGHVSSSGTWRIDRFEECIYPILNFSRNENGDIYADVDFDSPVYPEFIGQEIDYAAIELAASAYPKALETLTKATTKFEWQATKVDESTETIFLISKDGTQKAQIHIPSGKWMR